jgi:hypothetical protein
MEELADIVRLPLVGEKCVTNVCNILNKEDWLGLMR